MKTITLDLERMTSVPALHKYLRSALALPVYYGANLRSVRLSDGDCRAYSDHCAC